MTKIHVSELAPGLVVAEDVKSKNNQTIVTKGSALTRQNISRLKFYNINEVAIDDASIKRDRVVPERIVPITPEDEKKTPVPEVKVKPITAPIPEPIIPQAPPTSITPDLTKAAPIQAEVPAANAPLSMPKPEAPKPAPKIQPHVVFNATNQQHQLNYTASLSTLKDTFNDIVADGVRINEQQLLTQVNKAFDKSNTTLHLFDMLHNLRNSSDAVFAHSMNVALISATLGRWLKFSDKDVELLALCGLLHDIGKTMIPEAILNKPGKYTPEEYAQMKRHPLLGFQRLKNEEIDPRIKKAALMHHERADGSGYPHGLKGDEIHPFASIVAIADVYDAMTSSRSYRSPICPFEVIANFESEGLQKYDTKYLLTFLSNIANTYQNNRVILNDGRSGTIVMLNQAHLSKPIIQLESNQFLDLSSQSGLYIRAII